MVSVPASGLAEQAEEQEHVPRFNMIVRKVRLCGTCLSECASPVREHWVVVTQIGPGNSISGGRSDCLRKPKVSICCYRPMGGRDRQADWDSVDDGGGRTT